MDITVPSTKIEEKTRKWGKKGQIEIRSGRKEIRARYNGGKILGMM